MRATIHLVSAHDCVRLRPVVQPVLERGFAHAPFDVSGAETETLLEVGRQLTSERSFTRSDPDTPAPPRFLPEYDNLFLSHADRTRVTAGGEPVPLLRAPARARARCWWTACSPRPGASHAATTPQSSRSRRSEGWAIRTRSWPKRTAFSTSSRPTPPTTTSGSSRHRIDRTHGCGPAGGICYHSREGPANRALRELLLVSGPRLSLLLSGGDGCQVAGVHIGTTAGLTPGLGLVRPCRLNRRAGHRECHLERPHTRAIEVRRILGTDRCEARERARRDHQHALHIAVPRRTARIERAIGHDARRERRRNRRRENRDDILSAGKTYPAAQSRTRRGGRPGSSVRPVGPLAPLGPAGPAGPWGPRWLNASGNSPRGHFLPTSSTTSEPLALVSVAALGFRSASLDCPRSRRHGLTYTPDRIAARGR